MARIMRRFPGNKEAERSAQVGRPDAGPAVIGRDMRDGALPGLTGRAPAESARPSLLAIQRAAGNRAAAELVAERQAKPGEEATVDPKTLGQLPASVARITFRNAGPVEGTSTLPGHKGALELTSYTVQLPSGTHRRRDRRSLTFTKLSDRTTPIFFQAVNSNDTISSGRFESIHRNDAGGVDTDFTLEIKDAFLRSVKRFGDSDEIEILFESGK